MGLWFCLGGEHLNKYQNWVKGCCMTQVDDVLVTFQTEHPTSTINYASNPSFGLTISQCIRNFKEIPKITKPSNAKGIIYMFPNIILAVYKKYHPKKHPAKPPKMLPVQRITPSKHLLGSQIFSPFMRQVAVPSFLPWDFSNTLRRGRNHWAWKTTASVDEPACKCLILITGRNTNPSWKRLSTVKENVPLW